MKARFQISALAAALSVAALVALAAPALADPPTFGRTDVRSVFFIAKSQNRNQVHYGIRLDAQCAPVGAAPVVGYWKNLQRGPTNVSELRHSEERAYGIAFQRAAQRPDGSWYVRVALRAVAAREIRIVPSRDPQSGRCFAIAQMSMAHTIARLDSVFVQISGPLHVDWIELRGRRARGGEPVTERVAAP